MKKRVLMSTGIRRAAGAGAILAASGLSLILAVGGSSLTEPTLRFRCMDFNLMPDGTIQALVRLSAEQMDMFAGAGFKIEYNPDYIRLSDHKTNEIITDDAKARNYFVEDDALPLTVDGSSGRTSPIKAEVDSTDHKYSYLDDGDGVVSSPKGGTVRCKRLQMNFTFDKSLAGESFKSSIFKTLKPSPAAQISYLYGTASGKVSEENGRDGYNNDGLTGSSGQGLNLGELSFQVNLDNLTAMVENFSQNTANDQFLIGFYNYNAAQPDVYEQGSWQMQYYYTYNNNLNRLDTFRPENLNGLVKRDENTKARVVFEFVFPRTLVGAWVAGGDELTVNAYQTYGNGSMQDVIDTVQRYRPEITTKYANAEEVNVVMNWGETYTPEYKEPPEEMELTTNIFIDGSGKKRIPMSCKVFVPAEDPTTVTTNVYIDSKGNKWVPMTTYDPKGGTYLVVQGYQYTEQGEEKAFPLPMEVKLNVTPVNLVDVKAERLSDTYSKTTAVSFTDLLDLGLPEEALLVLSPVPGPVVLGMEIDSWTPNTLDGMTTNDVSPQPWPEAGGYTLKGPDRDAIVDYTNSQYPWVTTDGFDGAVEAARRVVEDVAYTPTPHYKATYVSTGIDDAGNDGVLGLRVTKVDKNGTEIGFTLGNGNQFRTYLPTGTMIDRVNDLPTLTAAIEKDKAYSSAVSSGATLVGYDLKYYPGATPTPGGEDVRRAINLGGWFYVDVSEDGGTTWSDLVPVYVEPRANYYIGSSESYYEADSRIYHFNFTGKQAGLYPFYSDSVLSTHVVLPVGYYVNTTYDGATGAEPGQLNQFYVSADWAAYGHDQGTPPTTATVPDWPSSAIVEHGHPTHNQGDSLKEALYPGFGTVSNEVNPRDQFARMDVQAPKYAGTDTPEPVPAPEESIRLIHEPEAAKPKDDPNGITLDGNGEVTKVTYSVATEGYKTRQTYTLTLENNGDTPIYGLSVDFAKGPHVPNNGAHFELVKAPAPELAPGGKTTFTVTYVRDLSAGDGSTHYLDDIIIRSNEKPELKRFQAEIRVTNQKVYKVTVVVAPDDESRGTAGLIKGFESGATPGGEPDVTTAGNRYETGYKNVWIQASPKEEFAIKEVYYDEGTEKVFLSVYSYTDQNNKEDKAYYFEMPAHDTTVHVVYYEPIYAQLRPQILRDYAGDDGNRIGGTTLIDSTITDPAQQPNRQKVYWDKRGGTQIGDPMVSDDFAADGGNGKYLVVLEDTPTVAYKLSQLQMILKDVVTTGDISIGGTYPTFPIRAMMQIKNPDGSIGPTLYDQPTGGATTLSSTECTTSIFNSPEVGKEFTVVITLSCQVTSPTTDYSTVPQDVSRSFEVRIVRIDKRESSGDLNYGNSPKGLIYDTYSDTDTRDAAWKAFVDNGYAFASGHTPAVAEGKLTNNYNTEAWSMLGSNGNMDANEYALFILLGQPFDDPGLKDLKDSAGVAVPASDVSRTVAKVHLLDAAATTQLGRFAGARVPGAASPAPLQEVTLELGTTDTVRVENWWTTTTVGDGDVETTTTYDIRPGVYTLTYSFKDFDGTTVLTRDRKLVILAAVGDVNADRKVDTVGGEKATSDVDYIRNRVSDPLGGDRDADYIYRYLFRMRVCDVNNDRNVNNIDASELKGKGAAVTPFYLPTGYHTTAP